MTPRQKTLLILLSLLLLALGLRLIGIENPLFEREPSAWRQIHNNSTSQGYLHHGFKFFHPEVNFMGNPGYFAQEFPLYQYLVALLYKLLGENVIWGRLFTIAASLGALTYLYFILRKYFGEVAAAAGAIYFAIIPLSVYYGRTVMMDTPVLLLSLAFTYHFLAYMEEGRRRYLFLAAGLAALAVLIKVTIALVFFGPLLILPFLLGKKVIYKKWEFYLFLFIPLAAFYAWQSYAVNLNLQYSTLTVQYDLRFLGYWIFGPWQMRLDPDFYHILFLRTVKQSLTWTGIFLTGAGIILVCWRKNFRPLLLYPLAAMGYLLTFTNIIFVHEHYQLPLVPVYAAFLGIFVGAAVEKIKNYGRQKNLLSSDKAEGFIAPALIILLGGLLLIPSLKEIWRYSKTLDYELMSSGKQVQQLLPADALVVSVTYDERPPAKYPRLTIYGNQYNIQPKTLYAVGHRGWNLGYSHFTLFKLEALKQAGGRFAVVDQFFTYPEQALWRDMIVESLRKNYKETFTSRRLLAFDLNQPPLLSSPRPGKSS